jgi:predicted  nucleic acid-binding Zn-ribbon protein
VSDLERLLDLQENDTATDRARHRRVTLPELAAIAELDATAAGLRAAIAGPTEERAALAREQKRLEDEVATLSAKIAKVSHRLYEEGLTSPKEAQDLQADLDSLQRHQRTLEDQILELMEQIEPLDVQIAEADERLSAIATDRDAQRASLAAAQGVIDTEIEGLVAARNALVAPIPAGLLDEYERIRASSGGVGVARLSGPTCTGCHLSLAAAEVDAIRRAPADVYNHCPDCGRLLVP